jgi:deazaflavin-dependent oxidoreductase (nitroreductase family)
VIQTSSARVGEHARQPAGGCGDWQDAVLDAVGDEGGHVGSVRRSGDRRTGRAVGPQSVIGVDPLIDRIGDPHDETRVVARGGRQQLNLDRQAPIHRCAIDMLTAATRPRLGRIVGAAGDRRGPKRYCSLDKRRLDGPECDDRAIGERCRRVGHRYRLATVEGLPCGGMATAAAATLRSKSNRRPTTTKRRPITVPRSANKNPRSRSDASAHRSQAPGPSGTQGLIQTLQTSVVNSLIRLAFRIGVPDPGDALLETTGRRTGKPRLTPVCDGLEGGAFWLLAQRGRDADWVRNIEADPLVRVKLRSRRPTTWRSGTAHILDDDDPHERQRILGRGKPWRRLCLSTSGALATDLLTVRIDLDPEVSSR